MIRSKHSALIAFPAMPALRWNMEAIRATLNHMDWRKGKWGSYPPPVVQASGPWGCLGHVCALTLEPLLEVVGGGWFQETPPTSSLAMMSAYTCKSMTELLGVIAVLSTESALLFWITWPGTDPIFYQFTMTGKSSLVECIKIYTVHKSNLFHRDGLALSTCLQKMVTVKLNVVIVYRTQVIFCG